MCFKALWLHFLNRDINLQLPLERFHFALQLADDLRGFTHVLHHFAFQVVQPADAEVAAERLSVTLQLR